MINIRWDSHTHSEICPHGSGDRTAAMIEKAIELNFTHYSITEHAPLPKGLLMDEEFQKEFSLSYEELNPYFTLTSELKKEYAGKIEVLIGLEFDFLSNYRDFSARIMREVKDYIDDAILSLHFLPVNGDYVPMDYSPSVLEKELVSHYGSIESVHDLYWQEIKELVKSDFSQNKPKRIGHLGLIYKFFKKLPVSMEKYSDSFLDEIFSSIRDNGLALEYNIAGKHQEHWGQPYLTPAMIKLCKQHKVPFYYASDAHSINKVGLLFDEYLQQL